MAWYIGAEQTYEDVDSKIEFEWPFSEEEMVVIDITFAHSGKAIFYTTGSGVDTIGYLNDYGVKIDEDYGEPLRHVAHNDDSSGSNYNFRIEYTVEAGERYFLYYRHLYSTSKGDITLVIIPPESEDEEYYEPDFSNTEIVVDVDGTDVDIELDGLDPDYEDVWKVQWYVYGSDDDVVDGVTLWSDGYDTRWSFDHLTLNADDDGIQPNTQYTVIAYIYTYPYDNGGLAAAKRATFTTGGTASPDRPEEFRWADGAETKKRGQKFDITADEWCDLLDNINAVREYKGYSKFPQGSYTGTSYYNRFTYPTSGQPFRYQHYNQALNAITGMLGYGYADNAVKQGDAITADRINLLVQWLNGIT